MLFSIFKAGTASWRGRGERGDYDGMFLDLLAGAGGEWEVHAVEKGVFPDDVGQYDGIVVTGSRFSVYDKLPWINRLLEVLREAYSREVPILGICFGHQAVAQALGGAVAGNPKGWDLGLKEVKLTGQGERLEAMRGAPLPIGILEVHQDIVTRLPPGAEHLAYSEMTEFEMFRLGSRVFALQGHPELDNKEVREIIATRKGVPEKVKRAGLETLRNEPDREFLQKLLVSFFKGEGWRDGAGSPARLHGGADAPCG